MQRLQVLAPAVARVGGGMGVVVQRALQRRAHGLAGQDAWRKHPVFSWKWHEAMPGIREGTAAFALYCVVDWARQPAH